MGGIRSSRSRRAGVLVASVVAIVAAACFPPPPPPPGVEPGHNDRVDCDDWRYGPPDPSVLPAEYDADDYKLTSERAENYKLKYSPHHLCGQKGAAVDLAWSISKGRDDVLIAVLDSGIEWRDRGAMSDLAVTAHLNAGELPVPAGSASHDANGDGRFDVRDYQSDPRVGDRNGNGLLDPEDLILAFPDGVDSDANGYTDDISGWDFLDNDNDALDEVEYGHGTGEAGDSTAAENGSGEVGTCPGCRHLPVRVGDSFLADTGRFAAGVLFALDSGVDVIQEALGALNNPPQAQQAIDAAYERGVPVVASMADEASKHPNPPGALERTLSTNSVTEATPIVLPESYLALNGCTNYGGHAFISVPSDGCSSEATGLGAGMVALAESTARDAGLARHPGLPADPGSNVLSANEVMQVVRATADDVDFSTPNDFDPANEFALKSIINFVRQSSRYPTTRGWDAVHGYGRINAFEIVKAIDEGAIPPEAQLDTPLWFDVLPITGSVAVTGRVAAVRSSSYSYRVEWAVGVQPPLDPSSDTWHIVAQQSGLTSPKTGTLATLNLAQIAAALPEAGRGVPAGTDGRPQEEKYTVRLRVVATDAQGRVGESQKQVFVHHDPDLVNGYPKRVAGVGGGSPTFIDLDRAPGAELVVPTDDGKIRVLKSDGSALAGWPAASDPVPYWHSGSETAQAEGIAAPGGAFLTGAPVVADIDHNGDLEVAAADLEGRVYVWEHTGQRRFVAHTNPAFSHTDARDEFNRLKPGFAMPPAAVDLDSDQQLELVASAMDRHVYAWHADGRPVTGFPVLLVDPATVSAVDPVSHKVTFKPEAKPGMGGELIATPAVGDVDRDGRPELVVGAQENYDEPPDVWIPLGIPGESGNTRLYVVRATGSATGAPVDAAPAHPHEQAYLAGWPVKLAMVIRDLLPSIGDGVATQAAIADVAGDSTPEIIAASASGPMYALTPQGSSAYGEIFGFPVAAAWLSAADMGAKRNSNDILSAVAFSGIAVGHMWPNSSNRPNIVAPAIGLGRALDILIPEHQEGDPQLMAWDGQTSKALPGFPRASADLSFFVTPAIVDLDGDTRPDAIAANGTYVLDAVRGDGYVPAGWPKLTGGWAVGTPGFGDWNNDGYLEVAVTRRDGVLLVWRTRASVWQTGQWPRAGHDPRNTANITTPTG